MDDQQIEFLLNGLPLDPLPPYASAIRSTDVPHAPVRSVPLSFAEKKIALKNALRYFPCDLHKELSSEFAYELEKYGHIYMYRLRPSFRLHAVAIDRLKTESRQAAAIILMVLNNLDPNVAQFPDELITYGGNGQVLSNWAQFWILLNYLATMNDEQTLVLYSGHPMGLFPSNKNAPRLVITNGMVIPTFSTKELYDKFFALGVTMYGQMTAGSYCYIGPQGIVHGTTITIMNAGRKYLGVDDLRGKVFVSSGLGGMSGAQPKAAVILRCIAVIAEVSEAALKKRYEQGWLDVYSSNLDEVLQLIKKHKQLQSSISIGYLGNVVDLWEKLACEYEKSGEILVELGSDQTSCHNPFNGGYYPVDLTFDEANAMIVENPELFKECVRQSLRRQIIAIDKLANGGMRFWDYGNAFLLQCHRAGADVCSSSSSSQSVDQTRFKYPSYVQDIMGDIFSMGFGPFRWVCTSCDPNDLRITDKIAAETLKSLAQCPAPLCVQQQLRDNLHWIEKAEGCQLVVGSQARILYSNMEGRIALALAFNAAVNDGRLKNGIVISRDHHDVSGTDSPFRETSNIEDGSAFTADMAVQNCVGDAFRGATWVALHNGGGVGWGDSINGGFGLFLDGSSEAARNAQCMLNWDVSNGVARRCWSGNVLARETAQRAVDDWPDLRLTMPHFVSDETILDEAFASSSGLIH